ncbi:hypothetical protein ILUMI_20172 [Ignelater luminosus]|uniref:Major facilitator superfamily (MFS) profile domain-containing protein n=1 Tax=Ignelater luminosus TaxID=2038154 RepID=A0A8K0CIZ5_IGNLU|nr:hypothetical protein ILUMI_20172 [Ignelater luminosus]
MSFEEASYLTVIQSAAAIISSPIFAKLLNSIGRKPTILIIAIPQFIAWIFIAFGNSLTTLYLGRAITGISDGAAFTTVPVYIGEILEPRLRGNLGSLLSFSIYFGQFFINVIGAYASMKVSALICGIFPIVFFVSFICMPESPYYLLMRNKTDAARNSLKRLRMTNNVEEELIKLTADVQRQISESNSMKDLFVIDSNRRAMFIAIGLRVAHQLSGIAAFSVYTQYLFEKSGSNISESISAIIFTGLQVIVVCFGPLIVDRFGRRPLMFFSCSGCAVLLTIEAIYFFFNEHTNIDVSYFKWMPLTGMLLYIIVFGVGFGIVPTLMLSELFSASIKGKAVCCMSLLYHFCISVTSKVFQLMADNLGLFAPFTLFSACCFCSILFSYYFVPETKGKSLEEIQQCLKNKRIK